MLACLIEGKIRFIDFKKDADGVAEKKYRKKQRVGRFFRGEDRAMKKKTRG